ncbi:hypothetical protein V1477_004809, partial [Vespula maculifrons]
MGGSPQWNQLISLAPGNASRSCSGDGNGGDGDGGGGGGGGGALSATSASRRSFANFSKEGKGRKGKGRVNDGCGDGDWGMKKKKKSTMEKRGWKEESGLFASSVGRKAENLYEEEVKIEKESFLSRCRLNLSWKEGDRISSRPRCDRAQSLRSTLMKRAVV